MDEPAAVTSAGAAGSSAGGAAGAVAAARTSARPVGALLGPVHAHQLADELTAGDHLVVAVVRVDEHGGVGGPERRPEVGRAHVDGDGGRPEAPRPEQRHHEVEPAVGVDPDGGAGSGTEAGQGPGHAVDLLDGRAEAQCAVALDPPPCDGVRTALGCGEQLVVDPHGRVVAPGGPWWAGPVPLTLPAREQPVTSHR